MKLHISDDNVFLDYAIEQFEAVSSGKNIYLVNTKKPKHIKNTDKIIAIEPESSEYKQYINQLENFDAVILHALTNDKIDIVNNAPKNVIFVWMFWGADGYILPKMKKYLYTSKTKSLIAKRRKNLKSIVFLVIKSIFYPLYLIYFVRKTGKLPFSLRLKKAIKRMDYIAPVVEEDFNRLKKNTRIKAKLLPFSYGSLEDLVDMEMTGNAKGNNILVGNSANPSNNHIDVFEKLKRLDLFEKKIIVPLSYGNVGNYAEVISDIGWEYFGKYYVPIVDFLKIDKYNALISSCNVVILNQMRQQAGGLVLISLWQGKKIFVNKESTLFQFYKNKNAIIFSTDEINEISLSTSLSNKEIDINKKVLSEYYSKEKALERTRMFIENVRT